MSTRVQAEAVPPGMRVQLARLFGDSSREARASHRTPAEWRRTLRKVLRELDGYLEANVDTDDLHRLMLASCVWAAEESLSDENFWPAYSEAITRFALVLLGDYPDHRSRKPGRKRDNHYDLSGRRSIQYSQSPKQRLRTLFFAGAMGALQFSRNPRDVMADFRQGAGYRATYRQFFRWYRKHYPEDYAKLF